MHNRGRYCTDKMAEIASVIIYASVYFAGFIACACNKIIIIMIMMLKLAK